GRRVRLPARRVGYRPSPPRRSGALYAASSARCEADLAVQRNRSAVSILARARLKNNPLHLTERVAPETQNGGKALAAEFAGIQRPAQLVEPRPLLVLHLIAGGLEQN